MGDRLKERDEDAPEEPGSMFKNVSRASVLQEARCFNDSQVDVQKCCDVITKLLYLLGRGEKLSSGEATNIFFSVTKLFQSKDERLRRMVYLIVKELTTSSDEVIMVTATLTKDMNSNNDLYRANAIRVLCSITDSAMLAQIERYLKQAIVDKQAFVASAALVSGLHLMKTNHDVVKRWVNEVNQAATDKRGPMVQYHALALMYGIKQQDRLAVSKLVSTLSRQQLRSPLATCLLIRYTVTVMNDSGDGGRQYYEFLESCLRHKSEMVICEAARAICDMPDVTVRELTPAITVLQLFLTSPKPTLRFAGVRALNKIAMSYPLSVTACNLDLETMISDSNRSIATLAITTLLKTGSESSVERLMKQITMFMSEIADEFKIVVVEAIRSLCMKYPAKHRSLINFLSNCLREEGGFEFKKSIVETIMALIEKIPEAKDTGLMQLCEFIEDCEFTYLSTQVLFMLGREGPSAPNPAKFIRFIYNRVILENVTVRAAAVTSLTKFGVAVPALRPQIIVLLERCLQDTDDEVRDRATFNLSMIKDLIAAGPGGSPMATRYLVDARPFAVEGVEKAILEYKEKEQFNVPFDLARVVALEGQQQAVAAMAKKNDDDSSPAARGGAGGHVGAGGGGAKKSVGASVYLGMLNAVPELAHLSGSLFKSSEPFELTESEAEYVVSCVTHVFEKNIVFQFSVTNTMEDYALSNVTVSMDTSDCEGIEFELAVPAAEVRHGTPGITFVSFEYDGESCPTGELGCTLSFMNHEVDPSTGEPDEEGLDDEYQLEAVPLTAGTYVKVTPLNDFRQAWEKIGSDNEMTSAFTLPPTIKSLGEALSTIISVTGLAAAESTATVGPNAKSHRALLHGQFIGHKSGMAIADLTTASGSIDMKLIVRADSELVASIIIESMT